MTSAVDPPTTSGPGGDPISGGTAEPGTDASSTGDSGSTGDSSSTGTTDDMLQCNFVFECEVPAPECDVWAQDCGPGEKCSAYGQHASENVRWSTMCVPVAENPAGPGEPCTAQEPDFEYGGHAYDGVHSGVDDCDAGSKCWGLDPSYHGICRPLCTGSADVPVCPESMDCFTLDHSGDDSHLIDLCLDLCDPVLADCAGMNDQCLHDLGRFACLLDESPFSNLPAHATCHYNHECLPGLHCGGYSDGCESDQEWCCLPYCDVTVDPNPACNPDLGETCIKMYPDDATPPGAEHVGVCKKPG